MAAASTPNGHDCSTDHGDLLLDDAEIIRPGSSAAADLTWRARAPEEATRRGLFPRLFSVVLRGSGGHRRHHRRRRSLFDRRRGAGRAGQGVVFLEAALFVFAARTACAGLVAPRSSNRASSHRTSVHPPRLVSLSLTERLYVLN